MNNKSMVHIPDREPRLHGVLAPPCRKGNALQIPGFGNGSIHSGIVRNGADLVCMDNPQTEKAISD